MRHTLRVLIDDKAAGRFAANQVAQKAAAAISARGRFMFGVSGGRTPRAMFLALADCATEWPAVTIFQVDERIPPLGGATRNLKHLNAALGPLGAEIRPMPVESRDLESAAKRYDMQLPDRFDLIHLGLGVDGHTASLVPDDPILDVTDRGVGLTAYRYQNTRRMTFTYPTLAKSRQLLWLVTGVEKHEALAELLNGDLQTPAGRVTAHASLVIADEAAFGD